MNKIIKVKCVEYTLKKLKLKFSEHLARDKPDRVEN